VMNQKDESEVKTPSALAPVAATPPQAGEARTPRVTWGWVERSVRTERMLTRLTSGESANVICTPWAAVLGSGARVDADNRRTTNPLTGEPDAGDPPVRFGGRGKVQSLVPTPIFGGLVERFSLCLHLPGVRRSAWWKQ